MSKRIELLMKLNDYSNVLHYQLTRPENEITDMTRAEIIARTYNAIVRTEKELAELEGKSCYLKEAHEPYAAIRIEEPIEMED